MITLITLLLLQPNVETTYIDDTHKHFCERAIDGEASTEYLELNDCLWLIY